MLKMPASTTAGGMAMTTGPTDVCKTPAPPAPFVPVPYPNIAQLTMAKSTVSKVKICNMKTVVQNSKVKPSNGDQAGTAGGGMVSNKIMGDCAFRKYSSKVYAKGKKIVHHTAMCTMNGAPPNTVGVHGTPSQTTVLVAL